MPTGTQGPATGLARRVVDFVQHEMSRNGWTVEHVADGIEMSKNYVAKRMRRELPFTLRDFEALAILCGYTPQEFLARVQFTPAYGYQGRLVPLYGVTADDTGMQIYRSVDADPDLNVASSVEDLQRRKPRTIYTLAADEGEISADQPYAD